MGIPTSLKRLAAQACIMNAIAYCIVGCNHLHSSTTAPEDRRHAPSTEGANPDAKSDVVPASHSGPSADGTSSAPSRATPKKSFPQALKQVQDEVASLVAFPSAPAVEIICMWQPHVSYLPDPSRNGAMTPGIAGQVFLFDRHHQLAKANGKLTVELHDETPVRSGGTARPLERWIFPKEILRQLVAFDETFGKNYTLFLPWPTYSSQIKQVRLMVKYEPEDGPPLYAPAESMSLMPNKVEFRHSQERVVVTPPAASSAPAPPAAR